MMAEELNAEETAAAEEAAASEKAAEEAAVAEKAEVEKVAAEKAATDKADWRDLLTDDGAKKQAERFESLDAVFKASADMRKQLSDRIILPGKDADEKEVAKFRNAMGIPEEAGGYRIELPDGMEMDDAEQALLDAVMPIAHKANVPNEVLSAFLIGFKELEAQLIREHVAGLEKHQEATVTELRKEWGSDYDPNVNIANRAMKQFGGDELVEFLNQTEMKDGGVLGNDPQMLRLFSKIGRQMSEEGVIMPVDHDEAKDLESQIDDLTVKAQTALNTGKRDLANKLFEERNVLAERLYGSEPVVGSAGRSL